MKHTSRYLLITAIAAGLMISGCQSRGGSSQPGTQTSASQQTGSQQSAGQQPGSLQPGQSQTNSQPSVNRKSDALSKPAASVENEVQTNALVVYLSDTETDRAADLISQVTGADMFRLPAGQSQTAGQGQATGQSQTTGQGQATGKDQASSQSLSPDLASYGTIFLSFSSPSGDLPGEIVSFLNRSELQNKTVIPVYMTPGADATGLNQKIMDQISEIELADSFAEAASDTLEADLSSWLSGLGYHS